MMEDDMEKLVEGEEEEEYDGTKFANTVLLSDEDSDDKKDDDDDDDDHDDHALMRTRVTGVLKAKYEKSSASAGSYRDDDFLKREHDHHQGDDALPEGEKSAKRQRTSIRSKSTRAHNYLENQIVWESRHEDLKRPKPDALVFYDPQRNLNEPPRYLYNKDLFFLKNGNTKEKRYVLSLYKIHAILFPEEDLEEKINRWVKKVFKTFNEEARLSIQHWKDSWHTRMYKIRYIKVRGDTEEVFSNYGIVKVVKATTDQQFKLDFMERIIVMIENNKPECFSEVDYKYLNKNDIEDMYYLCMNKKVNYHENKLLNSLLIFIRSCVIWERVHNFQLGIESYQIKINLTALTLTFPDIEACDPFSIVDKPTT
ncbi:hypothetical protein Tco_1292686, partial [Tanacetum coccineum]